VGISCGKKKFYDGTQQDVSEFMAELLDGIKKEEFSLNNTPSNIVDLIRGRVTYQREFTNSSNGSCESCGTTIQPNSQDFYVLSLPSRSPESPTIQLLVENIHEQIQMRCPNSSCSNRSNKAVQQTKLIEEMLVLGMGDCSCSQRRILSLFYINLNKLTK